jgi:hypothetical protein
MGTFIRSYTDVVTELRTKLQDNKTADAVANVYFSDAQYQQAIADAIEELSEEIFTIDDWEDDDGAFAASTITAGDRTYDIPMFVQKAVRVQRKLFTKAQTSIDPETLISPWIDVQFRQTRDVGNEKNELYLPGAGSWATETPFRVRYERPLTVPPSPLSITSGDPLADDATSVVYSLGDPAYEWEIPTWIRIGAEIMRVTATPLQGNVTVVRGVLGTIAAEHVQSSTIDPMIVTKTRQDYSLIRDISLANLYHAQIQNGNESRASIWITLYEQMNEKINRRKRGFGTRHEPAYLRSRQRGRRRMVL